MMIIIYFMLYKLYDQSNTAIFNLGEVYVNPYIKD